MEKQVFFFDIDGTLYDPIDKVCASTKLAIKKLQEAGHICALATGRSFIGSKDIARELGIQYVVCDGGNSVYINEQCAYAKSLDISFCQELVQYALTHHLTYVVMDNDYYYGEKKLEAMSLTHPWIEYNGKEMSNPNMIMKVGIVAEKEHQEAIIKQFPCHFYVFKDVMFLVTDQDNKHLGILKCKELMNYTGKHIVFGDSFNDVAMFKDAYFSICMGQAAAGVKAQASYVTSPIREEGIYKACVELGYFEVAE